MSESQQVAMLAVMMANMWVGLKAERSADMKADQSVLSSAGTSVELSVKRLAVHLVVTKAGCLVVEWVESMVETSVGWLVGVKAVQ